MDSYNLRGQDIIKGYENLRINGNNIVKEYNNLFTRLQDGYELKFLMYNGINGSVYCLFGYSRINNNEMIDDLNTKSYSSGVYFIEEDGIHKGYLSSHILNVSSNVGAKVGHLLFLFHILLSIRSNVANFDLENMTDDPGRAAKGIYNLLIVDKRGKHRNNFKNMSLSEQLHESEGSMRYIFKGDSEKQWKHNMIKLLKTIDHSYHLSENYKIWNINYIMKLISL
jgi:hypothetical protein